MSSDELSLNQRRLQLLESYAERKDLEIEYVSDDLFPGKNGLIYSLGTLGTGIAIRESLPLEKKVWVFAHELGHFLTGINDYLFSPLLYGGNGILDKTDIENERKANLKAFELIFDKETFLPVELKECIDIRWLSHKLMIPIEGVCAWDDYRLSKYPNALSKKFRLTPGLSAELEDRLNGKGNGGFQGIFRRILKSNKENLVQMQLKDFLSMRRQLLKARGGYATTYGNLLSQVRLPIQEAGGVDSFFELKESYSFDSSIYTSE